MKKLLRFVPFILFALVITACNEKITDVLSPNQAPHTFMSLMPDSGISKQPSKLKVSWWGDDPDGLVVGYYFSWDNVHWAFTTKNDSVFALKIGASDVNYDFKVAAADNGGNGTYDNSVVQNGIDFGPEPFLDENGDGKYTPGEKFIDIGLIDPKPASLKYPLKNSAPSLEFNQLTSLPEVSYPVMTLGWNASDIDGDESIVKIYIALNDTTKFITLPGNTRLVMLRMKDFNTTGAKTEILINASEGNLFPQKLDGFKLNDYNKVYIQAEDISGAKSKFTELPSASSSKKWYVKKPAGSVLIINDNQTDAAAADFFKNIFSTMHGGALANKYELWDINANKVPYENITFLETIKLFKYIFWYSDNAPNLNQASISSRKFIDYGGRIAFSMPLPERIDKSVSAAENSMLLNNLLKSFLPVDSVGSTYKKDYLTTLFSSSGKIIGVNSLYPDLKTSTSISVVRSIYPKESYAVPIYSLETTQLSGNKTIGIMDLDKKMFFIALSLAKADGNQGNVKLLLEKIFFEDFGLTL